MLIGCLSPARGLSEPRLPTALAICEGVVRQELEFLVLEGLSYDQKKADRGW